MTFFLHYELLNCLCAASLLFIARYHILVAFANSVWNYTARTRFIFNEDETAVCSCRISVLCRLYRHLYGRLGAAIHFRAAPFIVSQLRHVYHKCMFYRLIAMFSVVP